jgi:predicted lysophospholipase L1 biosynthesis ABC-type transport system permease subunit
MILQMEHRRPSLQFLHISGVPAPTIRALMLGEAGGVALASAAIGAIFAIALTRAALSHLTTILPTSLPVPTLGLFQAMLVALVATLVIGAAVTLAALAVVATQHRRIAERPIG